jgi:peroxiredoxin
LQQKYSEITARNTTLLAISPMVRSISGAFVEKLGLEYPVLSDGGNSVAGQFGLVHTLPETLQPIYSKFGIDLAKANGDTSHQLPLPATYILDQEGVVTFSYVDADYTIRLDPDVMLTELDALLER